jgi:hypothetical protein
VSSASHVTSVQSGYLTAPLNNNHNALLTEPVSQTRRPIPGYKWWVGFRWLAVRCLSSAVRRHFEGINVTDDLKRTKYDHITLPARSPKERSAVQTAKANFNKEDLKYEIWDTHGGDYEYVTPCNPVVFLRFKWMHCLYLQGRRVLAFSAYSWIWRRGLGGGDCVPPKWQNYRLHAFAFKNIALLIYSLSVRLPETPLLIPLVSEFSVFKEMKWRWYIAQVEIR